MAAPPVPVDPVGSVRIAGVAAPRIARLLSGAFRAPRPAATPAVQGKDGIVSASSRSRIPRTRAGAQRAFVLLAMLLGLSGPGAVAAQDGADVVVTVAVAFTAPYA